VLMMGSLPSSSAVSPHWHVQISVLFFMEKCDQAVMDSLAATDVGQFPPKLAEESGQEEHRQEERAQD